MKLQIAKLKKEKKMDLKKGKKLLKEYTKSAKRI